MECFNKDNEKVAVSAAAEEKVNYIVTNFHIRKKESWGFDANSDNGMQDMHYSTTYEDLIASNFIVEGDNVIGYKYQEFTTLFDGSKKALIHSWDNSKYGGSTDEIDTGIFEIVKKEESI